MAYSYEQINAFLNPASIALVGASEGLNSIPGRATRYVFGMGFAGQIAPVNPKRPRIFGALAYADIEAIPFPIDLALILRPFQEVAGIVKACARKKVPYVIVAAGGFAEMGQQGALRQKKLHDLAREAGIRVLGPNCMGYLNLYGKICTTFSPVVELPLIAGGVGIVSQSGAMAGAIMNRLQDADVGISCLVSTGNEMDLGTNDFLNYFIDDEKTKVIVTYLEGIKDGRGFLSAAGRAYQAGKPLVVLTAGMSSLGKSIAASHTGAMAASRDVLMGALRQYGAIVCNDMEELIGTVRLLSLHNELNGDGIGVIATSGGAAAIFADKAQEMGLSLPCFTPKTSQRLSSILKFATAHNPVDLTGQVVTGDDAFFTETLRLILEDENIDFLVLLITQIRGPSGQALFSAVAELAANCPKPITAVCVVGSMVADSIHLLKETRRITMFTSFGECARAIGNVLGYQTLRRKRQKEAAPVCSKNT
jgi:acetyltransferase